MRTSKRGDVYISQDETYYVLIRYEYQGESYLFMQLSLSYHNLIDSYSFKQHPNVSYTSEQMLNLNWEYTFSLTEDLDELL